MQESTRDEIERWWRDVFDVDRERWSSVTVSHPHESHGDHEGWFVASRDGGVHVSAPSSAEAHEVASLANEAAIALRDAAFWPAVAFGMVVEGARRRREPRRVARRRAARLRALCDPARGQAWMVAGLNDGRVASNAVMSSSCPSVMPMSSSPSSSRHRV